MNNHKPTKASGVLAAIFLGLNGAASAEENRPDPDGKPVPVVQAALERLKLPGVEINLGERCVDVASEICLDHGTLELVACRPDSKEHESIVTVDARAMHIHTALLLLGAKSGHPAMRKQVGGEDEEKRWIEIPPKGGPVEVSLVVETEEGKPIERPIGDFIEAADPAGAESEAEERKTPRKKFPTHTFLFAGSHLVAEGKGPRTYLSDRSGNVISIATFGNEMLCLPEVHSHENGSLLWQIDKTHLPEVGTKVILRLRPKLK